MTEVALRASWTGYCASCAADRPLLLVARGPRGLLAWVNGVGPEDRSLSYCCGVCGRVEYVPRTEAEDRAYDLTLPRWPDWVSDPLTLPRRGSVAWQQLESDDGYDAGGWYDPGAHDPGEAAGDDVDLGPRGQGSDEQGFDDGSGQDAFAVAATDVYLGDTTSVVVLLSARAKVPGQRGRDVPHRPVSTPAVGSVQIEVQAGGRVGITDGPISHVA